MDECLAILEHLCPPYEEEFAGLYEGEPLTEYDDDDDGNDGLTARQF